MISTVLNPVFIMCFGHNFCPGKSCYNFILLTTDYQPTCSHTFHSRTDGMGNSTLSLNVSNNSGASSAEGMITSALMPYESQSGPTISLERQLKASRRGAALGHSNGLGSMKSSSAGATRYGGLNSTSSTLYSFTTSPPSGEQPVPAR